MIKKRCACDVQREDGVITVTLHGEIDHHSAVGVRGEIDALIYEERPKSVVLDMSDIDFMDSSGLGLVMGRYALMQKTGGEFALRAPNPRIKKIFELAGLERIIKIEEDGK